MALDLDATATILRHADPKKLAPLIVPLRAAKEDLQVLAVAVDAALEAGRIAPRYEFRAKRAKKGVSFLLGKYLGKAAAYGAEIACYEDERLVAEGDARALVRAWAVEAAERVCLAHGETDPRALEAIAAARVHVEGGSTARLDRARDGGRAAWAEANPHVAPASVAARTAAVSTSLEDAWEAGYYVASTAAGWLEAPLTHAIQQLTSRDGPLSRAAVVVLEAHWAKLNEELGARVVAALAARG
ncbi:MAG: hypothetical protein IPJ34_34170 [Myxococcales bacterium]|nr:hypothetical protein [Myxococcales bacterium]